jgi:hypothetical protein
MHALMQSEFQNALAYCAGAKSYARKMFIKLTPFMISCQFLKPLEVLRSDGLQPYLNLLDLPWANTLA